MTGSVPDRRTVLKTLAMGVPAALAARPARSQESARVVVIGGGFAGATAARVIARNGFPTILVEQNDSFAACPFSNAVIAGLRPFEAQVFGYEGLKKEGVEVQIRRAAAVDPTARRVAFEDGSAPLSYDRLILAPGIDLRFDAVPGYDEKAAERMPHAWKAGAQTLLLRRQLEAMEDGGTVVLSSPPNPFRCPPGPYERASLIAHYLKTRKPRSKLLILDAKDRFSKQGLFQAAWKELYPDLLEWVPLSSGGNVTSVDPSTMTLITDFERYKASVANVIPPQTAGRLAAAAGVADRTGWCPIDPATFESRLQPNIHVIGDAAIAGAMPKSAFAANAQAKACAAAATALLRDEKAPTPKLINTCYSLVAPDYGISVAGVYRPSAEKIFVDIDGAGGASPADAPASFRAREATYAEAWFETITTEVFG